MMKSQPWGRKKKAVGHSWQAARTAVDAPVNCHKLRRLPAKLGDPQTDCGQLGRERVDARRLEAPIEAQLLGRDRGPSR